MTKKFIIAEQSALSIGGHYFVYTSCVARAAQKAGYVVTVLCNTRLPVSSLETPFSVVPCFTQTWGEAEARGFVPFGPGHFPFELDSGLDRLGAGPDDLVFIHTCAYAELKGLLDYFCSLPPQRTHPQFHVLLRYDPEFLVDNLSYYVNFFDFVSKSKHLRDIVHFHSDTDPLAKEFSALSALQFGVCPIPFDQSFLFSNTGSKPAAPAIPLLRGFSRSIGAKTKTANPLTIVYLGDARPEKGYQHFPAAIECLWRDYLATGRARFVLQSNFNVPGGEPGMLEAAQKLSQYGACVHLRSEALGPRDYYALLAESDIVVLPYSAERYRFRSSGVLVEAMTAGKVIVTTKGSWMDSEVSPDHAVVYARGEELGPAIVQAIDRFDELKRGAEARQFAAKAKSDPASLVAYLIQSTPTEGRQSPHAPLAFFITDGGSFVLSNGASKVAETQLRYLEAAGYRIAGLFLNHDLTPPSDEWKAALISKLHSYKLERVFIAGPGQNHLARFRDMRLRGYRETDDHSIANDIERTKAYDFSVDLVSYLRQNAPDVIMLNYVTSFPVVEALGLAGTPVICEMHDIQSFQKAIYARRPISKADLDLEFALLEKCDYLISLNERETRYVEERLPGRRIATIGPLIDVSPPDPELLAAVADCAEIIAGAGPKRPDLQFAQLGERLSEESRILAEFDGGFDLLFVSSAHKANVAGLNWFFEEVYEPFLAPRTVTMVVAGSIDRLGPFSRDFKKVAFIGQVANLEPLYAATKIVVLPVAEGAGSAIKTYEALSKCKPLVATSAALRGIDSSQIGVRAYDDAEAFAQAVLSLLESPQERLHAARRSFEAARTLNSFAAYSRQMNDVFGTVLGKKALSAPTVEARVDFRNALVEWSEALQAANRALRACLEGRPLDSPQSWARFRAEGKTLFERSAACLLDRRSAPLLRNARAIFEMVSRMARFVSADDIGLIADIAMGGKGGEGADSSTGAVLVNSRFDGRIVCQAREDFSLRESPAPTSFIPLALDTRPDAGRLGWRFSRGDKQGLPEHALLRLPLERKGVDWVVHQDAPISRDAKVLGEPMFHRWIFEARDGKPSALKVREVVEAPPAENRQGFFSRAWNMARQKLRAPKKGAQLFDRDWYLDQYPDVRQVGVDPLKHFMRHGAREGRNPNPYFDTTWYLREHADAVESGLNPLDHYLAIGAALGYDPSPRFSTSAYLDENPDVREAGLNPLAHFLGYGRREGRDPPPSPSGHPPQTILLPAVASDHGQSFVELELAAKNRSLAADELEIFVEGEKAPFALTRRGAAFVARVALSFQAAKQFGLVRLSLSAKSKTQPPSAILLTAIRVGWSSTSIELETRPAGVEPDRSRARAGEDFGAAPHDAEQPIEAVGAAAEPVFATGVRPMRETFPSAERVAASGEGH